MATLETAARAAGKVHQTRRGRGTRPGYGTRPGGSRWRLARGALWLMLSALLAALAAGSAATAAAVPPSAPTGQRLPDPAEITASLTLEEKIGQLFIIHAYGTTPADRSPAAVEGNRALHGVDTWEDVLRRYSPGGVVYFEFTGNIANPAQVAALSNGLQAVALEGPPGIPLLIAVDQEQGHVRRIAEPATQFPGAMALAATGDPGYARAAAYITGKELRAMGVNVNFAPVADVNANPFNPVIGIRSFGDRPGQVAAFTAAQVAGYRDAGIAATAKHFPGHGDTAVDSHTGLPTILHTAEHAAATDLPPFQAAIDAGVDLVMTAHIVVPALDPPGRPATFSPAILEGLLREQMGFDGPIITDSLAMAGAQETFDPRRVPVEALKAGADLLLMPPHLGTAFQAVLDAVRSGELDEARIDASVRRIIALKQKLGLFGQPFVDEAAVAQNVGIPDHLVLAEAAAVDGITVVKNGAGLLPLGTGRFPRVAVTGWGEQTTATFTSLLRQHGFQAHGKATGADPDGQAIEEAVAAAQDAGLTFVLTWDALRYPGQQALVRALAATGTPLVVVAVGTPYDIAAFPEVATYVATYGYRPVSLAAALYVLLGGTNPRGRLPVDIPRLDGGAAPLYPAGFGLACWERGENCSGRPPVW